MGMDDGAPFPTYAAHQRVAHWDTARELGILDLEAGADWRVRCSPSIAATARDCCVR